MKVTTENDEVADTATDIEPPDVTTDIVDPIEESDITIIPPTTTDTTLEEVVGLTTKKSRKKRTKTDDESVPTPKPIKKKKLDVHTELLVGIFTMVHLAVFKALAMEVMTPSEDENRMLAKAVESVAAEYDMEVSSKQAAWINLVTAMTSVYGSRVYMYLALKGTTGEKKEDRP